MTDKSRDSNQNKSVGLRGRFKAASLVGPLVEKKEEYQGQIPVAQEQQYHQTAVTMKRWINNGTEVAAQFLMPIIAGQPKANKRDVESYFDPETGMIQGSKEYLHADLTYESFKEKIGQFNGRPDETHTLRNYAMVCKENQVFNGTLGVENCTTEEIAALLLLLEHDIAKHGFKIGLDKALGLGSMTSSIKRVWIRDKVSSGQGKKWHCVDAKSNIDLQSLKKKSGKKTISLADLQAQNNSDGNLLTGLEEHICEIKKKVEALKEVGEIQLQLNRTEGGDGRELDYPKPGFRYWTDFKNRSR